MAVPVDEKLQKRENRVYPWDEWTDGQTRDLYRGFDFTVDTEQFRNRMYTVGKPRGLNAITKVRIEPREEWPPEVQEAVSGPETEVLRVQFVAAE